MLVNDQKKYNLHDTFFILFCDLFLYAMRCLFLLLLFSHHRFLLLPRTSKTYAIGRIQEELSLTNSEVAIIITTRTTTTAKKNSLFS